MGEYRGDTRRAPSPQFTQTSSRLVPRDALTPSTRAAMYFSNEPDSAGLSVGIGSSMMEAPPPPWRSGWCRGIGPCVSDVPRLSDSNVAAVSKDEFSPV